MNPTLASLIRHAELFGVECVYETGEQYLRESELVQLAIELERIANEHQQGKRFRKPVQRRRLTKEQKLRTVSYLVDEGLPNSRIATHLGVSERQVERLRREAREQAAQAA
jgi:FixJ family two-component response regulator